VALFRKTLSWCDQQVERRIEQEVGLHDYA
jgi:hypothetical protein